MNNVLDLIKKTMIALDKELDKTPWSKPEQREQIKSMILRQKEMWMDLFILNAELLEK